MARDLVSVSPLALIEVVIWPLFRIAAGRNSFRRLVAPCGIAEWRLSRVKRARKEARHTTIIAVVFDVSAAAGRSSSVGRRVAGEKSMEYELVVTHRLSVLRSSTCRARTHQAVG